MTRQLEQANESPVDGEPRSPQIQRDQFHVCPGAQLTRPRLRVVLDELLRGVEAFALLPSADPVRAICPASGFSALFLTPA